MGGKKDGMREEAGKREHEGVEKGDREKEDT